MPIPTHAAAPHEIYDDLMREHNDEDSPSPVVHAMAQMEGQFRLIKKTADSRGLLEKNLPTQDRGALLSPRLFWCGYCAAEDKKNCVVACAGLGKLDGALKHLNTHHPQLQQLVRGNVALADLEESPPSKLTVAQLTSKYKPAPAADEFDTAAEVSHLSCIARAPGAPPSKMRPA